MLARRFTIVCLLVAIFGMGLATLVVEAERAQRPMAQGSQVSCVFEQTSRCASPAIR